MGNEEFGPYSTAADAKTLRAIRRFMEEERAIIEMEVATKLERPAVEPLSDHLLARFDPEIIRRDGVKKYIGWLARRILEPRGYLINQQNCLVRTGGLFSRGTRYRRAGQ